ncbi:1-aminocyclopropane-1-carboxylate synthase [Heterostelium album PN500]|uniref:1-aminocyclopropane-1-carboxylate synthase n=1 Tax=Heterostelium pallidum (strain ATCC 26659 / Pp 5 / PN500) TaxID=670386 RepID=D3BSS7_HETP5|nr:1-aminocyclopropane-1-carboxylate synthase [Heterostelium album PN500]EFA75542.1 1-aminocyclopropane-1-carboxylate synthase [Heterostelium album PN500]|eukprot:XP_020427676.1 1-aminocyclopropane-1-carboxylate synthase [Heterostelium album PN500]
MSISDRAMVELKPQAGSNPKLDMAIMTAVRDMYDQASNPNGYIFCSIAENKLCYDLLKPKLEHDPNLSQLLANYSMFGGMACFKKSITTMLENYVFKCAAGEVSPNHLLVGAGTTCLLEALFFGLFEPEDYVMIPSPMYQAFVTDARVRARVKVLPVSMTSIDSANGDISFRLSVAEFEKVYAHAVATGAKVKGVLLCSPNNPTGTIFGHEELLSIVDFCKEKQIHLISDEIYSLSMFSDKPFTSIYQVLAGALGDSVHIVSGFSKDFCVNGYRAGYVYTQNAKLMHYLMKSSVFFSCSNPVQSTLKNILTDQPYLKNYIETNQSRLKQHYELTTKLLDENNIPYLKSESGMYLMLDLRRVMKDITFESEIKVWEEIFDNAKVLINPGKTCMFDQPGFYRFIFTQPEPVLRLAIERIAKVYNNLLNQNIEKLYISTGQINTCRLFKRKEFKME